MIPYHMQHKYLLLFTPYLNLCKQTSNTVWNFRCPYCGDSEKNKFKRRGYLYESGGNIVFKCHNCGKPATLFDMIREFSPALYTDAMIEFFGNKSNDNLEYKTSKKMDSFKKNTHTVLGKLQRISEKTKLQHDYLYSRGFEISDMRKFYAVDDIQETISDIADYGTTDYGHDSAVGIPYLYDGNLAYLQMRRLSDKGLRYITFEIDGGHKLFGLDYIDKTKQISILEGAFDSVFIKNSVANGGAQDLNNIKYLMTISKDLRFIYDNDYRYNKNVKSQLLKRISEGHSCVIYDNWFKWKDVNSAIVAGVSRKDINDYMDNRTFKGLRANLELSRLAN